MGYDQRFSRRKVGCKVFKYLKLNKVLFFFAQDSRAGLEFIMIRISQLRLPCGYAAGALENKIGKTLRMEGRSLTYTIVRHSVDARKKPQLFDTYTVDVDTGLGPGGEAALLKRLKNRNVTIAPEEDYCFPVGGGERLSHRPVVIGAGPAGLFCALFLAEHGYRPLLIERGRPMEQRTADVEQFWKTGILDPASNVQFGEGGAGTFSDGKLNTQVNDRTGRSTQVLRIFVEAGAPDSILYEGKPHIGTDRLRQVIPQIRRRIEEAGGEVRFGCVCTGFTYEENTTDAETEEEGKPERRLTGLRVRHISFAGGEPFCAGRDHSSAVGEACGQEEWIPAETVVFAVGHSARDTIEELFREKIPMEQKQFAVGFRVAHPQKLIDQSQYGLCDPDQMRRMRLSASPYKLTAKASSGRGVYSFCMCPGGYIVNASSEQGRLCVNGMSDEGRDSGWANSAIVITVGQEEFGSSAVLAGMEFQRALEQRAWEMGKGAIPVQQYRTLRKCFFAEQEKVDAGENLAESEKNWCEETFQAEERFAAQAVRGACRKAPLHTLLSSALTLDFIEGMDQFGHKIEGFDGENAVVAGIESRTSSPVRIPRGKTCQSVGAAGLYPCGEGAGYAGGIMSAAMDGIRVAEAIARRYAPVDKEYALASDILKKEK